MNNTQNNNGKPKTPEVVSSAIVKIHKSTLDFIERVSQRWEKGDHLGAIIQAVILMEVLFFGMFLGLILVHLIPSVNVEFALCMIPIIMGVLFLVIILVILIRGPDDKRLAEGQRTRHNMIGPRSLYRKAS
jgi:vacuolar-type H+-ATPase subunit I/STV1